MGNKKKHLSKEERFFIEKMLKTGNSISIIAKLLERGLSTISEEISRNGGRKGYSLNTSTNRAYYKQYKKKVIYNKIILNKKLRSFVTSHLARGLSPEVISELLREKSS